MGGAFAFNAGEELILDLDVIGKEVTQVAKTASPTFPDYDANEMLWSQATLTVDGTAYGAVCSGLTFNLGNNYEKRHRLGSVYTQAPLRRGVSDLSGSLRIDWEATPSAKTLWDRFKSNTPVAIVVTATHPSGYSFVKTLPRVFFNASDLTPDEGQLQSTEFPFEAYNPTSGATTAVQVVVTSPTATV